MLKVFRLKMYLLNSPYLNPFLTVLFNCINVLFAYSSNYVVDIYGLFQPSDNNCCGGNTDVSCKHCNVVMQKEFISYLAQKWKRISAEIISFAVAEKLTWNAGFLVIHSESLHICLALTFRRWLFHNTVSKQICCHPGLGNAKPLKPAYTADLKCLISD